MPHVGRVYWGSVPTLRGYAALRAPRDTQGRKMRGASGSGPPGDFSSYKRHRAVAVSGNAQKTNSHVCELLADRVPHTNGN